MATSMMQNKKSSGAWQTVKSKSDDKKKRVDDKKKQDVVEDRLGVAVPKKNVFAAMDTAWKKQAEQPATKVPDDSPYAGAFTGLAVEQVALEEPESPVTPPNSDRQPSKESSQRKEAESKVKKPKKVKPSILQVAEGVVLSDLNAHFQDWELKYEGNQVSQLEMLADFFLRTFKECELPFNNILAEKSTDQATDIPLAEVPSSLTDAVRAFLVTRQIENLKSLVLMLLSATFEGLPEGTKVKTGVPPPKAKVGLLLLLALVLRTRPQALLAATPDILLSGRMYTAPGRIPQLLWVFNQAAIVSPSATVAVWTRLVLPQLLGSDAYGKKAEAPDAKINSMDLPAHSPVLGYVEQLLSKPIDADIEISSHVVPTVPGYVVEAISQSCFVDAATGLVPAPTRTRLQALFPQLQNLAAKSCSTAHFLGWLPLALDTAASTSGGFEGAGDKAVARATTSVIACLAGNPACHTLYLQKHKGHIKGSARVLQQMANSPASLLRPLTTYPEVAGLFKDLLTQLPSRHRFYLHQGRGKGWQGSAARAAETAILALQRRVNRCGGSSSSLRISILTSLLLATAASVSIIYAAHNRQAVVAKASEHLSPEHSALLLQALKTVDVKVVEITEVVRPQVEAALQVVNPQVEAALDALRPHMEALSARVVGVVEQLASSPLGIKAQPYMHAAAAKVQMLLSSN